MLRVLACQIEVPATSSAAARDQHVARMIAATEARLAVQSADLVVWPELCTISYDRETFERLDDLAETVDGPSFAAFAALAKRHSVVVAFGMPTVAGDGFRISQVIIDAQGEVVGVYDKLHAAQYGLSMEKEFFTTGDSLVSFEVNGFSIAPIICYDIRFPELCRTLAVDHRVDLILHCSAFARDESFESWHAFVTARAMENQLYMLGLSRAGDTWGGSLLCGPWVDTDHPPLRFPEHDEAFEYLTIERSEIARVREAYTFLDDRKADYKGLRSGTATPNTKGEAR